MKSATHTKPDRPGRRVREFFELEAQALLQRFHVMETLLPHPTTAGAAHRGEEGRHIEALLREFLNKHLPKDLQAVSGFILRPSTKVGQDDNSRPLKDNDEHSRQLDVIVYDFARFPVYERFEEFAIVPPEGVVAVISVKKTLYESQLEGELVSLAHASDLCRVDGKRAPFTAVVSFSLAKGFKSSAPEVCYNAIKKIHNGDAFDRMVTEMCVISEFTVFKYRAEDSDRSGQAKFVAVNAKNKPNISLQRLINSILSVYYDETQGIGCARPGFVSFEKGTFKTAPCLGYVTIGKRE